METVLVPRFVCLFVFKDSNCYPAQACPATELHQGSQGGLCQRQGKPQEGERWHSGVSTHVDSFSGEEACGEGMVLQALRPQVPLYQTGSQPVLLKLGLKTQLQNTGFKTRKSNMWTSRVSGLVHSQIYPGPASLGLSPTSFVYKANPPQ